METRAAAPPPPPPPLSRESSTVGARVVIEKSRFWEPPELKQDWGQDQSAVARVGWSELFFDLLFVAVLFRLGEFLAAELSAERLALTALLMYVFWSTWMDFTTLHSRFSSEDLFTVLCLFVYDAGALGMAVFVRDGLDDRKGFALSFVVSRAALLVLYAKVRAAVPRAAPFASMMMAGFAAQAGCFLAAAFASASVAPVLWLLGMMAAYAAQVGTFQFNSTRLPINVEHMAERCGLWIMLSHGESVISLIVNAQHSQAAVAVVALGFAVVFEFRYLYYDAQPHRADDHALRASRARGRWFIWHHFFLSTALELVGVALKLLLKHADKPHVVASEAYLFCGAVAAALVFLNCVRLTHPFRVRRLRVWLARVVGTCLVALLPLLHTRLTAAGMVGVASSVLFVLSLIDMRNSEVVRVTRNLVVDQFGNRVVETAAAAAARLASPHRAPTASKLPATSPRSAVPSRASASRRRPPVASPRGEPQQPQPQPQQPQPQLAERSSAVSGSLSRAETAVSEAALLRTQRSSTSESLDSDAPQRTSASQPPPPRVDEEAEAEAEVEAETEAARRGLDGVRVEFGHGEARASGGDAAVVQSEAAEALEEEEAKEAADDEAEDAAAAEPEPASEVEGVV